MSLSAQQCQSLREKLVVRRAELRMLIKEALSEAGHETLLGQVHDRGEEAFADLLVGVDLAVLGLDTRELAEVDEALAALAEGRYGVCSDCAEPIPYERLESRPTSRRCLECQMQAEELLVGQ